MKLDRKKLIRKIFYGFINYLIVGGFFCMCCLERGGFNDYLFVGIRSKNFGR